jgi:hypothetical protein
MGGERLFHTDYVYSDRETKAHYVWLKYRPILKGRLLDVGADECHLKKHLDNASGSEKEGRCFFAERQVPI